MGFQPIAKGDLKPPDPSLILLCLKYCLHFQKSMRLYNWL